MSGSTKEPGARARSIRDKHEETNRAAWAVIDAEREAALRKTARLREERIARETADAEAATAAPAKSSKRKR